MAHQDAGGTAGEMPAYVEQKLGDLIRLLERALADHERALGADHPDTLGSRRDLAMAYAVSRRSAEAITLCQRALADHERVLGADHRNTSMVRRILAALTANR